MNSNKSILFIPSNDNHVRIFSLISKHLESSYRVLFLSQESYKNEGAEKALIELGILFRKFDDYDENNPSYILKQENVGAIVIGNDTDVIPQWFVNSANKLRIPTILIQDGMLFDYNTIERGLSKILKSNKSDRKLLNLALHLTIKRQYRRGLTYGGAGCTQIHVWGKAAESYLISKGIRIERMVIIGAIKIEEELKRIKAEDESGKNRILYIPTDLVHSNIVESAHLEELTNTVCSTALSFKDMGIIVKPHPREDKTIYENMKKKYGSKVEITSSNTYELLPKSSIVITDLSTAAIEALAVRKPVIIFLPKLQDVVPPTFFPHDLITRNAVLFANNRENLLEQITKIRNGVFSPPKESVDQIVEEYLGPMDGNSSLRSSNAIAKLLNQ